MHLLRARKRVGVALQEHGGGVSGHGAAAQVRGLLGGAREVGQHPQIGGAQRDLPQGLAGGQQAGLFRRFCGGQHAGGGQQREKQGHVALKEAHGRSPIP